MTEITWPPEAREAVRAAVFDAIVLSDPWACADAALAALAPFVAAQIAAASEEGRIAGLREAADILMIRANPALATSVLHRAAAAILARAEESKP